MVQMDAMFWKITAQFFGSASGYDVISNAFFAEFITMSRNGKRYTRKTIATNFSAQLGCLNAALLIYTQNSRL